MCIRCQNSTAEALYHALVFLTSLIGRQVDNVSLYSNSRTEVSNIGAVEEKLFPPSNSGMKLIYDS
jgi:hypothetical protein